MADTDDERLEALEERIDQVREQTKETAGDLDPPGQEYYQSGDERSQEQDDQTIAPPG